jgi:hypothetical protein
MNFERGPEGRLLRLGSKQGNGRQRQGNYRLQKQ